MATEQARKELDEWIADAVREGYTVDSRVGDRAFISRRVGVSGLAVFVYIVLIIVLFPIGLLFIIPWVNASKRTIRFELSIDEDGDIVQRDLGKSPELIEADRRAGRNLALAGLAAAVLGLIVSAVANLSLIGNFAVLAGIIVAIVGAWKFFNARN